MKDKTDVLVDLIRQLYCEYLTLPGPTELDLITFRTYLREEICDLFGIKEDEWVFTEDDEGEEEDGD